jgi:hypothetical protein
MGTHANPLLTFGYSGSVPVAENLEKESGKELSGPLNRESPA